MLCYSHPMKAVVWVAVYYERLFSNLQSPKMDEEQVLPRFDPFEPFRSLLKMKCNFDNEIAFPKAFALRKLWGKRNMHCHLHSLCLSAITVKIL